MKFVVINYIPKIYINFKQMTPKDKAEEIVKRMNKSLFNDGDLFYSRKCALVAIDYLIETTYSEDCQEGGFLYQNTTEFWQDVKKIIDKPNLL